MVTCQNCRASWPDNSKFCGRCGHQISKLANEETVLLAGHAKHLEKRRNRHHLSSLTSIGLSLIFVLIMSFTLLFIFFNKSDSNSISPKATLIAYGKVISGKTLQVVGHYFTPEQTVFVTIDDQPLAQNEARAHMWYSAALNLPIASLPSTDSSGTPVTVQADGTFTIEIHIDTHWAVGSTHHLSADDQQGNEIKGLNFTVEPDQSTPTPTPTQPILIQPIPTYPTPTSSMDSTPTPMPRPKPTPSPSPTPTPTPTPKPTPTPTPTPIPMPSPTPMPTPSPMPSPT